MNEITINKKTLIIITIIFAIFICFISFIIIKFKSDNSVSKIEEIKLKEVSHITMSYISEIEENKSSELDKYVIFALEYSLHENNKKEVNLEEVISIVGNRFNINISSEELSLLGITPLMVEKGISYEPIEEIFTIKDKKKTQSEISSIPITKYLLINSEKDGEEYILTYQKYVVSNPYKILDYYNEKNNKIDKIEDKIDVTEINEYLKGNKIKRVIENYVTEENAEIIAKNKGIIKVIYIVKNDKILIDRIEN